MKSLLTLHISVLHDVGQLCSAETFRDAHRITSRWEHEGDSFLTITLPAFAKALEKGLADGRWPRQDALGFKYVRGLPAFLRGFLTLVFHPSGVILDSPSADAIYAIRQICLLSQKVERDPALHRVKDAYKGYQKTEEVLRESTWSEEDPLFKKVRLAFVSLYSELLSDLDRKVREFDLVPNHGPGSTADGLTPYQKWDLTYWPERLEEVFPRWRYSQNVLTSWEDHDFQSIEQEIPVKVITVPKTQKGPRIIAMEPATVQYAQQALKGEIYRAVKSSDLFHLIGFTDQDRNQKLAQKASLTGDLATLDLSEASDRVSWKLVQSLFRGWPNLLDFLDATRTRVANVNGSFVELAKYASMGSALTFPIEAMVFTAVVVARVWEAEGRRSSASQLAGRVSVYGDDIIVPTHAAEGVISDLESLDFKVNRNKSFWTGLFRESCGTDWFAGTDVSVIRLRADVPTSRLDASLIAKLTDFRNRAYHSGLWGTVKTIDGMLDQHIKLPAHTVLPQGSSSDLGILAKDTFLTTVMDRSVYYDSSNQIWKRRYPRLRPHAKAWNRTDERGYLEWFHRALHASEPLDAYERQERPVAFSITTGGVEWHPCCSTGLRTCEMGP